MDEDFDLWTMLLPLILLQPIIENAILHGLIVDPKPGAHLEVRLAKTANGVFFTVSNNGLGINYTSKQPKKTGGI
ncbi:hypothetical protein NAF17_06275 [Mucilaginibacter sp. RB4R14]|uniref:hypothetical protein n=1 Tax=Mucilaginibacter aurantiaciroseus TaxID=2949308 RepID=UPI00209030F0|nr:hypothetical protein [Mucilaginibacter aurantiaciroseus]MCO5935138.1 hypothetical protein [Mucilaginibacter aurantiaciroseus]